MVLGQLVLYIYNLFIWAVIVCRFICEKKRFIHKKLNIILKGSSNIITAPDKHFDEIYLTILKYSISSEYSNEEIKEVYYILKYMFGNITILLLSFSIFLLSKLL